MNAVVGEAEHDDRADDDDPVDEFVPDISGVCSIVGTFEMTSKPRKIASTRTVSSTTRLVVGHVPSSARGRAACGRARHAGAGRDLVVEVEHQLALRREVLRAAP